MNKPEIKSDHTFVILAYRESPFIEECVLSLKNQKVASNILLSTSTPNDFLTTLSQKYNIPLHLNPKGGNMAADWNFAYSICNTKYLTLAHQDDIYYPEYAAECRGLAASCKSTSILFTDYDEIYDGKLRSSNLILRVKRLILFSFFGFGNSIEKMWRKKYLLAFGTPISCPTVLFNKEQIGDLKFSEEFTVNLDWDAWRRISKADGTFLYCKKHLMAHRIYKDSQTTVGMENNKRYEEDKKLFEAFWPKPIATLLTKFYALSYKSNKT